MQERSVRSEFRGPNALLTAIACLAALASAGPVRARPADPIKSTFAVDDNDPEGSVPSAEAAMKRPLDMGYYVMSLSDKAEAASKQGDHAAAVKYWRALAKAVPDRSVAFSKMCKAYEAAGDRDNALVACRAALGRGGVTVDDNLRFARLVLAKPTALGDAEIADVDAVIAHLERELGDEGALVAGRLRCDLAVRLEDVARLRACTKQLQAKAPNDPQTIAYTWALALKERNFARAETILEAAERAKLPAAALDKMNETLAAERKRGAPFWQRTLGDPRSVAVFAGFALLAAGAAVAIRRRQRLRVA
jgi:hypothetical protein